MQGVGRPVCGHPGLDINRTQAKPGWSHTRAIRHFPAPRWSPGSGEGSFRTLLGGRAPGDTGAFTVPAASHPAASPDRSLCCAGSKLLLVQGFYLNTCKVQHPMGSSLCSLEGHFTDLILRGLIKCYGISSILC